MGTAMNFHSIATGSHHRSINLPITSESSQHSFRLAIEMLIQSYHLNLIKLYNQILC
jgi:hypothetical protein